MPTQHSMAYVGGSDEAGSGHLGIPDKTLIRTPQPIELIKESVHAVAAGGMHSVALTNKGIYTWGNGDQFATGRNDLDNAMVPTLIFKHKNVSKIAASDGLTCCISNRKLYAVGTFRGENGVIGINNETLIQENLGLIQVGDNENIADVKTGNNHVVLLTESNKVYAFGACTVFQTGFRTSTRVLARWCMTDTVLISDVKLIGTGDDNSFFVKSNNDIYVCGINGFGQIGLPANEPQFQAIKKNSMLTNFFKRLGEIIQIDGGSENTLFLVQLTKGNKKQNTEVYGIGGTKYGVLGREGKDSGEAWLDKPVKIQFPKGVEINKIACGGRVGLAISKDGIAYSWVCYLYLCRERH